MDSAAAAGLVQIAQSQGVKIIAYDQPIPDVPADYYVSFDNQGIGAAIAQSLVDHLKAEGVAAAAGVLQTNGSPSQTTAPEPILRLRGASKQFGAVSALTDIDLDMNAGEVVALVGAITAPANPRGSRCWRACTSRPPGRLNSWASPCRWTARHGAGNGHRYGFSGSGTIRELGRGREPVSWP